jgi:hypothetical protein
MQPPGRVRCLIAGRSGQPKRPGPAGRRPRMRPRWAPAGSDRDELDVDPGGLGQGVQVSRIGGEDFIAAPGLPPSFTGIDDTPGMKRLGQQRGAPEQPECDLSCHGTHGLASAPTRLATARSNAAGVTCIPNERPFCIAAAWASEASQS